MRRTAQSPLSAISLILHKFRTSGQDDHLSWCRRGDSNPHRVAPSPGRVIQGTLLNPYMARIFIGLSVFCPCLWERYGHEKGEFLR